MQTIFSFFQEEIPILSTIKVKDLVDVAILSLVIYKALWLMRKTSSGRVLRGITVLILALCLAYGFRLTATGYLLNKVVEWGILMLVILFQPELRQALERMAAESSPMYFPHPVPCRFMISIPPSPRRWRPTPPCPRTRLER